MKGERRKKGKSAFSPMFRATSYCPEPAKGEHGVGRRSGWLGLLLVLAMTTLAGCTADDDLGLDTRPASGAPLRVDLWCEEGFGELSRTAARQADYSRVEFLVADGEGRVLTNFKGHYDDAAGAIRLEGLGPGQYRLLVVGVRGDWEADSVTFLPLSHTSETWLRFPADGPRALAAEYFFSATPFSVRAVAGPAGQELTSDLPSAVVQQRVVGRLDVDVRFDNPYLSSAVQTAGVVVRAPAFYTAMTAEGRFSAPTSGGDLLLSLDSAASFLLLPSCEDRQLSGEVGVLTRNYLGEEVWREYGFQTSPVLSNCVNTVAVDAVHPEDGTGTLFVTAPAYRQGQHALILQDDEPHSVYTDKSLRFFNTSRPMQVSVTTDGRLNVRFYSPKPVAKVLLRARLPAAGNEWVDLAFFDSIPAFADFHAPLPVLTGTYVYRTASRRIVKLPPQSVESLQQAEFQITSPDPYWEKLQRIKHGWNVGFDLYGGDPTQPDGGPKGNWMGIRPVHCREVVAFFLNFTYMIDMPEHEEILRANEDRLYGNGGVDDKVTAETVLAQMRQNRTVRVGLVYTGNNVLGLGGGDVFGAYQGGWFEHYTSAYACEVMFHELGHVMGYSHDSSFTYGPWAQELMNYFYINNLEKMPVESATYLNSAANPNKY